MNFSKWTSFGYAPSGVLLFLILTTWLEAHQHLPITHSFNVGEEPSLPKLVLNIVDRSTGQNLPARFSLEVDGESFNPEWIDDQGISFTSIHLSKNQRSTVQFAKGTGPVRVSVPRDARTVSVSVAKGFEYRVAKQSVEIFSETTELTVELERWVNLKEDGWIAIDEHLHYDRLGPEDDPLWFSMFQADGLEAGHFMVLKGGMTPGVWSRQFKYGEKGQGTDGNQILIPGQEYRDSQQGHINLLGLNEIILPYSTGGMGTPAVMENYPPLFDVLTLTRARNGLAGVAHGGTLGRNSTSVADAVLGAVDFWEISNGFIYNTENWYRLMNCGIFLPMVAGTDLPNSPLRDDWQPMFGSIRTYVNTGGAISFNSFKEALKAGRSFISGGPLIDFQVNDLKMGDVLHLSAGGGVVTVRAVLHSPLLLRQLVVVQDGRDLDLTIRKRAMADVHRWSIEADVKVTESGWLSAWGRGAEIKAQKFDAMAHAGVVRVIVGDQPVQSSEDAEVLIASFRDRISFYDTNGVYQTDEQRNSALGLFKEAIQTLEPQL
ncbi:MAG: CehA/McbA family metallohydrolase [Verrucomicrobia bacterium]|nr:CehA/McbA family metallohydrolase [Verrucomicrobiota bacterium]MDA1066618.1 CehA/McbA family metallohydrolase [Verrucomicrobiota bacterium]